MICFRNGSISLGFSSVSQMLSRSTLIFTLDSWVTQVVIFFLYASFWKWLQTDWRRTLNWLATLWLIICPYSLIVSRISSLLSIIHRLERDSSLTQKFPERKLTDRLCAAVFKTSPPQTTRMSSQASNVLSSFSNEGRVRYQQSELKWDLDRWVQRVSHSYPITEINPNAL